MNRQGRVLVVGAVGLLVTCLIWELALRVFDIQPFVLQAPSEIATEFRRQPDLYLGAAGTTARNAAIALGLSLTLSLVLGAMLAMSRLLEEAAQPVLMLILVTPWVAYLPSLVIAFGAGAPPALFLITFVTLPAFTFAMVAGLRSADGAARELFASVDASRWEVLLRLRLPSALPTVLAAARFNAGLALGASYFVDGGNLDNTGLGAVGRAAQTVSNGPGLWTAIATTAALGFGFLAVITIVERLTLGWHISQRS